MFDVGKLLCHGCELPDLHVEFRDKRWIYRYTRPTFNTESVGHVINLILYLDRRDPYRLPVEINLGKICFEDKLSYVLLECLCYYMIKEQRRAVVVIFEECPDINTDGVWLSPLRVLKKHNAQTKKVYEDKFKLDISQRHYRRLITVDKVKQNKYYISSLVADISNFLKPFDGGEKYRDELAEVIGELVDNSIEHAKADCLVDLDISRDYIKNITGEDFLGINVTVLNLSSTLLGDPMQSKLSNSGVWNERDRYVLEAFNNHQRFMDETYTLKDFYNIASFQDRISGRNEVATTGGTGLTKLVSSLEKESDTYNCYIISGNRKLEFIHDFLEYNSDGWIGFNKERDFLTAPPSPGIIVRSPLFIQGTAYNLCFAMKKEDIHG